MKTKYYNNYKVLILKLLTLIVVALPISLYSQTIYQFNDKQLIEDAPYFLDITTEDTLVISPRSLLIVFFEGLETQGDYYASSLGLVNKGNLFGKHVYKKPDSLCFIQTITLLASHSSVEEVLLDYCFSYPRNLSLRTNDTITTFDQINGYEEDDECLEGLDWPDDAFIGWPYELMKSKICVDFTISDYDYCHRAWYYTTGSPEIIVALIDRGLMWNDDDFSPDNGLGYDYVNWTTNVYPDVHDDIELGTSHASIIGARTSNQYALAGVAGGIHSPGEEVVEGTTLMILKATTDNYNLSGIAAAFSIIHAVDNNAKIINFPWATSNPELIDLLNWAIDYAVDNNVVVFAPTGDYRGLHDTDVLFPANREDVIAVGATDMNNSLATWVDQYYNHCGSRSGHATQISLPGYQVTIRDIYWPSGHWKFTSTTISTSLASGIAALMLAEYPCLTNQEIKDILIASCVQVGGYDYNHDPDKPGHSLELGYGLVDAYLAVSAVRSLFDDYYVTEDETWSTDRIHGNIIIDHESTLTLNSIELGMMQGKKIIIEQGSKLIVNGGKITSHCGATWQGIEVWGNNEEHQWPDAQGYYSQGYLELNDAIIENAINAVSLWKPGDYSTTGGIVIAENTVFRNNKRSVHALHYNNFHPTNGNEMDYRASFKYCSFELDEEYPGAEKFYKHVDLDRVRGVKFQACNFSLSPDAPNVSTWNMGIGSYSAGFSAEGICTLADQNICVEYDPITFSGFNWAIDAHNQTSTTRTFYVNLAQFNSNVYGIRTNGVNHFAVLNSEFNIGYNHGGEKDFCENAAGYGIHLSSCFGFAIEENIFTKAQGAPQANYIGVYASHTGELSNEIYRNTFSGLSGANVADGENNHPFWNWIGLSYLCNQNDMNYVDFLVCDIESVISVWQGDDNIPAGNKFSATATGHFINRGPLNIGYYHCVHKDCGSDQYPDIIERVTREPVNTPNPCPPNYGGGGNDPKPLVLDDDEKSALEMQFALALSDHNNVKTLYNNLEDDGSTEIKTSEVSSTTSADMWERRTQLLGTSPHLSEEVLKAVADRSDVFPESVIFEIFAANPDELRKESLLEYLEEKEDPLPVYMVEILRQMAGGTSYKSVLQQQMANYSRIKTRAANKIIRSYLNDSIADMDALRNWLDNLGGISSDRQIIASYVQEGNFGMALSLANMLPGLYGLEGESLEAHNRYMEMLNLQHTLHTQNRRIDEFNNDEIIQLQGIALAGKDIAANWAKSVLESCYDQYFFDCFDIDGTQSFKSSAIDPGKLARAYGLSITAKPNPARHWVAFDYTLPGDETSAELIITDALGRPIETFKLSGNQGQQVFDTRKLPKGAYLFTIKTAGFVKTGKFVISK